MTVTNESEAALTRTQTRFLRRIYNGRAIPIVVNDLPFLTYRDASQYLRSLTPEARDTAYAEIKVQAKLPRRAIEE